MNYQQALDYMYASLPMYQRIGKAAYRANLDNTHQLDEYFRQPHKQFKSIHIAGTNGKGSLSHMLASILQEGGYKTGLYTSPHLLDFRERIRINGELIDKDFIVEFISKHKQFFSKLAPSFFEITVAMAFSYFADKKVDIAVIETGLGGRLDSTNIITPLVSVITNIGLDHTQFLGDNLASIAREKAGIIKPNIAVVVGETHAATTDIFTSIAKEKNAPLFFADQHYHHQYALYHTYTDEIEHHIMQVSPNHPIALKTDLKGEYQRKNIVTCQRVVDVLALSVELGNTAIKNGLKKVVKNTGLRGRWEVTNNNPLTVCDTGHNYEGLTYIIEQLKQAAYQQLHLVLGFIDEKDISKLLTLFPSDAYFYLTESSVARSAKIDQLTAASDEVKLQKVSFFSRVEKAVLEAKASANENDFIFIGGSTFVVADYLQTL